MLTRVRIENAKPGPKPLRLYDGRGLYLEITPSGGRGWRFKYTFAGKEKRISLGVYPEVCVFRLMPATDSAACRPPIPRHVGRGLRGMSAPSVEVIQRGG